ncbi:MAG TPA: hypothetical protein VKZ49_01855 [Polyangiaceae bacterium]|nr:hypothetical protein [Polyangiaceae bacterium]
MRELPNRRKALARAPAAVALGAWLGAALGAPACQSEDRDGAAAGGTAGSGGGGAGGLAGAAAGAAGAAGAGAGAASGGLGGLAGSAGALTGGSAGSSGASGGAAAAGGGISGSSGAAGAAGGTGCPDRPPPACPTFGVPTLAGYLEAEEITEASGLAVSASQPGVIFTHNDRGASARLYAIGTDGIVKARFDLEGATAADWEDIAIGPGPIAELDYVYVGDIGDNTSTRPDIVVYRLPEPVVPETPASDPVSVDGVVALRFRYPEATPHNAETLMIDPDSGDLFIATRAAVGTSRLYRAPAPHSETELGVLELVMVLDFTRCDLSGHIVTAGDISRSGGHIMLRTFETAFFWPQAPGASVAEAHAGRPCAAPLPDVEGGEALGITPSGDGYYVLSEGLFQPLVWTPVSD